MKMTVLDRDVEFKKVLMVIARKTIKKEVPLKEGFEYVQYTDDLYEDWCKLHLDTKMFETIEEAHKKLDEMLEKDKQFFIDNFLFVKDSEGKIVASAGLWYGKDFDEDRLRLHFVSVAQSAQHNKIAQSMITKLCMMYDKIPSKYPLYLATQSQSYGAISLYARIGFNAYLGAYKGCSEKENEAAWEFTTKVLQEKATRH